MNQNISIAVTLQPLVIGYLHPSKNQHLPLYQSMGIKPMPDSD
jgi:hypothetical protein